jgi:hypothetical protein
MHLRSYYSYYKSLTASGIPFISVNYNDLVDNPEQILAEIRKLVGMTYRSGKENFWEKNHHFLFRSPGISRQVRNKNSIIYKRSEWLDEFKLEVDSLTRTVLKNKKLRQILIDMEMNDIGKIHNYVPKRYKKRLKPIWYYYRTARRIYQRYFPEAVHQT